MDKLRNLRRPGATVAAALVLALSMVTVMKESNWPKVRVCGKPAPAQTASGCKSETWWERGGWADVTFIGLYSLTGMASFLVAMGFRRALSADVRKSRFEVAAKEIALIVEQQTSLAHTEIGVNIWLVKGVKGFQRLRREAQEVARIRTETKIEWTKGKGVIGAAWGTGKPLCPDLDVIRRALPIEEAFCKLSRDERLRLSWDEFMKTERYCAVLAVPLYRNRYRYTVRGVLAIDSLIPGKAKELRAVKETAEFNSIIRTCEETLKVRG